MNSNNNDDIREMVLAQVGSRRIDMTVTPRKLAEVLDEISPQGENTKLAQHVGKKLTIWHLEPFVGQYGPAAWCIFTTEDGEMFNTVIGQRIVLPKLLTVMDYLPVTFTLIEKEGGQYGRYYDVE